MQSSCKKVWKHKSVLKNIKVRKYFYKEKSHMQYILLFFLNKLFKLLTLWNTFYFPHCKLLQNLFPTKIITWKKFEGRWSRKHCRRKCRKTVRTRWSWSLLASSRNITSYPQKISSACWPGCLRKAGSKIKLNKAGSNDHEIWMRKSPWCLNPTHAFVDNWVRLGTGEAVHPME